MRVVVNTRAGGFNLSRRACRTLFARGWTAPNRLRCSRSSHEYCSSLWIAPDGVRYDVDSVAFRSHSDVVRVVERLGDRAHPIPGALAIVDVPVGIPIAIGEHPTGIEWVFEQHRTWGTA